MIELTRKQVIVALLTWVVAVGTLGVFNILGERIIRKQAAIIEQYESQGQPESYSARMWTGRAYIMNGDTLVTLTFSEWKKLAEER